MTRNRAGLHKKISNIFDGVPIPQKSEPTLGLDSSQEQNTTVHPQNTPDANVKPQNIEPSGPVEANVNKIDQRQLLTKKRVNPKKSKNEVWAESVFFKKVRAFVETKLLKTAPGVSRGRQFAMIILAPLLVVIFIVSITGNMKGSAKPGINKSAGGRKKETKKEVKIIEWEIPALYPTSIRDPMAISEATSTSETGTTRLVVAGIVYSDDKPSAIINNKIVHQGDKINGATVVLINRSEVEFEMSGKKWTQKVRLVKNILPGKS